MAGTTGVTCGRCKAELAEAADLPAEERLPCPHCGARVREIQRYIFASDSAQGGERAMVNVTGQKKAFIEHRDEPSMSRKEGRLMRRERLIDRANDRYYEHVIDPETGETIHECDEPLSNHRGHGDARK